MAGVPDNELQRYAGFPGGIDNVSREESVNNTRLRAAVNVDIDDAGKLSRRAGYTLKLSMLGLHSVFADARFPYMLAATETTLSVFDDTLAVVTTVALARNATMSYAICGTELRYSNGWDCGIITESGAHKAWSAPMPAGQPTVGVNALAGGLNAGEYQVAITFVDAHGRESGSHAAAFVEVPENGGLLLSDWPEQTADVAWVSVYVTEANGDMLYLAETLPAPVTGALLIGKRVLGRALDTMFLTPMPACRYLCVQNGRLYGEVNGVLVWSEALNYGLTKRHENWAQYKSITMIAATGQTGLFVAAEKRTVYQAGTTPAEWTRTIASAATAVPYSLSYVQASELGLEAPGLVPVWLDTKGEVVVGLPDGSVFRLHKDYYLSNANAEQGASMLRRANGVTQLLVATKGGTVNTARAGDTVDVEVCRNGVIVS